MRVLVASTGGAGHFGPLVAFIDELAAAGHEVLLVVAPELAGRVQATGLPFAVGRSPRPEALERLWSRFARAAPQEQAVLVNRELFGRLCTAAMLPTLERSVGEYRPDLVVREPCEYASAIAAERHGVPHAQVAISLAKVEHGSLELAAPVLGDRLLSRLRASPYLTRFPARLDPSPFPDTRRYREPLPAPAPLPDWWNGSTAPLVYVTFGTVAAALEVGAAAYRLAVAAVTGLPARVLVTTAGAQLPEPLPSNVHAQSWVPQVDVLAAASLVVCHGGSGTAFGALMAGVPLASVPLFADQRRNAAVINRAGAGLTVELHDDPAALRAVIDTLSTDASYRDAATRIAVGMRPAPGPLEAILNPHACTGT